MKVLHVFKTYYPDTFGGMERAIHAIATGVAAHGIESHVLSLSADPAANTVELDGHRARKAKTTIDIASTGFSFQAFRMFDEMAAGSDIIHYHFPWPFMDLLHLIRRPGRPTLVTYQSDIVRQKTLLAIYRPLMHRFLGSVDAIVASSPNYLETSPTLARYKTKTRIIPNGLDDRRDVDRDAEPPIRPNRPYFLFVGVHRYYKGLDHLIAAAPDTEADIIIAGEGPETPRLKKMASGVANVHFTGDIGDAEKHALLRGAYGYVMPSHLRSEAFGLALLEGAMFGLPLVSCEIGTGTTYINAPGETGLAVPPANPQALAGAMNTLVSDHTLARQYGEAARARYERLFTAQRMAGAYADLYAELAQRPPMGVAIRS